MARLKSLGSFEKEMQSIEREERKMVRGADRRRNEGG
jgi:hypothetical protein